MKLFWIISLICITSIAIPVYLTAQEPDDPYLWLEEVEGEKAMEWVAAQNQNTVEILQAHPEYQDVYEKTLNILNSKERLPYPSIIGESIHNFWNDEKNERGLWRRTSYKEYFKENPDWETVLDLDALSEKESEKWAYKGAIFLYPDANLFLLNLSRGGSDAVEIREFDLQQKTFVEGGFLVPNAKSDVYWIDQNTLLVATDFGEGTLTTSGYPRMVKIWKRGTDLSDAKLLYEGKETDMGVFPYVQNTPERQYVTLYKYMTFFSSQVFVLERDALIQLDIPEDAVFDGFFKNHMVIELKSDWTVQGTTYKQGSLIGLDFNRYLEGSRDFQVIFEPDDRSSLKSVATTRNLLLINKLTHIRSELLSCILEGDQWQSKKVNAPDLGTITLCTTDDFSDRYFIEFENFLTPSSLYFGQDDNPVKVKSMPQFFNGEQFTAEQFEATSEDGTQIPYFIVHAKDMKVDGTNPTLIYGYGGFEISECPAYLSISGPTWLEKGGVYVIANIRGGGEFGPKWHQAALKEKRQNAYDDFYAVAEDLIQRKITSPRHLGIMGGSNGGLLVGVAFTQRPDLYNAVVCQAPLLDMKRYNKLLAGASWMDEYGNPDIPEEWEYIQKYSPYQNLKDAVKYPKVLFTTTTRDDRVHPGHARKMAALMEAKGHESFYFENTEGGHGAGVTNEQRARMMSLETTYLLKMLK
jgi:prolyl oligopeptidase